ncbi:MAG: DUF2975 domain-containing protein [Enterococcus sp.]|uniref:DUF2975 domain-containing protein n=1 Tax=Enterococcus raffinosus TaxID=71452 RepID=UPI001C0F99E3|nr:DUF2975 domain-containing protein [Enterococcus raffinosus]MBU5359826.1 DUF2975 domain-containing protein [Enterococcus raffinosus]
MKLKVNLLKLALVIISFLVLFVTVIFTFQFYSEKKDVVNSIFLIAVFGSVLLGFRVLFLLNRILNFIKGAEAFSDKTLKVVSKIKKLILLISIVFLGILPFFYRVADRQDAPGVLVIGLAFVSIPFTAFVFSQIVEELFKSATELKSDSELTI